MNTLNRDVLARFVDETRLDVFTAHHILRVRCRKYLEEGHGSVNSQESTWTP